MNVKRIGFLGIRTPHVAETASFFRDVLGLTPRLSNDDWMIQTLPSGEWDLVEIFGEDFDDPRLFPPEAQDVFIAFIVDDLAAARAEVEAAGVEILGDTIWADEAFGNPKLAGLGWFFVRAPDGNVYVLQQYD